MALNIHQFYQVQLSVFPSQIEQPLTFCLDLIVDLILQLFQILVPQYHKIGHWNLFIHLIDFLNHLILKLWVNLPPLNLFLDYFFDSVESYLIKRSQIHIWQILLELICVIFEQLSEGKSRQEWQARSLGFQIILETSD